LPRHFECKICLPIDGRCGTVARYLRDVTSAVSGPSVSDTVRVGRGSGGVKGVICGVSSPPELVQHRAMLCYTQPLFALSRRASGKEQHHRATAS
jgi:hypothetical protein